MTVRLWTKRARTSRLGESFPTSRFDRPFGNFRVMPELVRLQGEVKWPVDVTQGLEVDPMSLV